jgi:hypothetical protein
MCLDYIEEVILDPIDTEWKVGYKLVALTGDYVGPIYQNREQQYKRNIQYKDTNNNIIEIYEYLIQYSNTINDPHISNAYPTGFHIFISLDDADCYLTFCGNITNQKIFKVLYRQVVAIGTQFDYKCVVAREIEFKEEAVFV